MKPNYNTWTNMDQQTDFFEEFPCLLHNLSLILTALDYKTSVKSKQTRGL